MIITENIQNFIEIVAITFLVSSIFIFLALRFFSKLKLLDKPEKYKLTRKPIPYYGGLVIYLSFLVSVLIFVPFSFKILGLIIGSFIIVIVGFLDDKYSIKPWIRLMAQFCACLLLVLFGIGIYRRKKLMCLSILMRARQARCFRMKWQANHFRS